MANLVTILQFLAALIFALVAGSVFGIWRGYDPTGMSQMSFVEVHQGAVRGLNFLLPVMAIAAILCTVVLTWLARDKGLAFWLYLGAVLLMVGGGVITRLLNQPINDQVMTWAAGSVPANWEELRSAWWNWHMLRTALSVPAFALLLGAILTDRPAP